MGAASSLTLLALCIVSGVIVKQHRECCWHIPRPWKSECVQRRLCRALWPGPGCSHCTRDGALPIFTLSLCRLHPFCLRFAELRWGGARGCHSDCEEQQQKQTPRNSRSDSNLCRETCQKLLQGMYIFKNILQNLKKIRSMYKQVGFSNFLERGFKSRFSLFLDDSGD